MSRNAKRVRVSILNPPDGCQPTTSLEHARRYVKRGTAEWVEGSIRFIHRRRTQAQRPTPDEVSEGPVEVQDSGFSGFARYPMPDWASRSSVATMAARRFPALARLGAGL